MTLVKLPQLQDIYETEIYGIDRVNGVLYAVYPVGMKKLRIRSRIEKEGTPPAIPKPFQSMLLSKVAPNLKLLLRQLWGQLWSTYPEQ